MSEPKPLLIASETDETREIAEALNADWLGLPPFTAPQSFESWRDEVIAGEPREQIVVAPWLGSPPKQEFNRTDRDAWQSRFEQPYLLWNFALGAAGQRCANRGSIVGLAQMPAALDSWGFTPEVALGEGALSLVRSVAAAQGPRGVRANLVTTPIGLIQEASVAPPPPLPGFPGTIKGAVVGTIRTLLSKDAAALTGRVLPADGGRSI